MANLFSELTITDVLWAAAGAYILTTLILWVTRAKNMRPNDIVSEGKTMDLAAVMAKCKELFPIDTIYFHGRVFRRGMRIKITTLQHKVIEGELIGKNKVDQVCIRTRNHIVAHEIDKIEDISLLEENPGA